MDSPDSHQQTHVPERHGTHYQDVKARRLKADTNRCRDNDFNGTATAAVSVMPD
jgi:hypothetical protein